MRSQRGVTLIELLIVIAILAIIAAVVIPQMGNLMEWHDEGTEPPTARARYIELRNRPISSLNVTELQFVVDYEVDPSNMLPDPRHSRAAVYQNQIIITKLDTLLQAEVNR